MKAITQFVNNSLNKTLLLTLLLFGVLLPTVILPLSDNFLIVSKFYMVFAAALIAFVLWAVFTLTKKSVQLTLSPYFGPLVLFAIISVVSIFMNNTYVASSLLGYGGLYVALVMLIVFASSLLNNKDSKTLLDTLIIPALFLSLASGAELLGWGPSRIVNVLLKTQYPSSPVFSLSGSPLITVQFLLMVLAGIAAVFFANRKKVNPFHIVSGAIIVIGIAINTYILVQAQKTTPIFLPYAASWSIAVDSLKSAKTALIGFGPDNFGELYLRLKPAWINTSSVWAVQFIQANNIVFSLLTTVGIIGLVSWALVVVQAVRRSFMRSPATLPAAAIFLAGVVLQLLLPLNVVILGIQALALIFWIAAEKHLFKDIQLHAFTVHLVKSEGEAQRVPHHSDVMVYAITGINVLITLALLYFLGRATLADMAMFRAELATLNNKAVDVYNLQRDAIVMNPYLDGYRRKYSSTNMAIAIALANSKDTSNPDRDKVVGLIQQAIQESKAAILLDDKNSLNWLNLGRVYTNLIGIADQADQWAIDAYSQAIAFAPTDPILRLELGGIFFRTGKYDQAAQVFQQLINLKPNWPNAFYNLALTYRAQQKYDMAVAAYQQTLGLLDSSSEDYAKVKAEMQEMIAQVQKGQGGNANAAKKPETNTQPIAPARLASPASTLVAPTVSASPAAQFTVNKKAKDVLSSPLPSPTL